MTNVERRHLHVVAALIERDGQVLLDRRRADSHLGGLWEFPGGKREAGESDEAALIRELQEELGVASRVLGPPIGRVEFAYESFDMTLVLYPTELQGTPSAVGVDAIQWHPIEVLKTLPMPPANQSLLEAALKTTPAHQTP